MGLDPEYIDGQTPLDEEEINGLLIPTIVTHGELNEFEQQNIEQAIQWTLSRNFSADSILTDTFIRRVHKEMFGLVWTWAGEFRKSEKNIGIAHWKIPVELKQLLEDTKYWIDNGVYSGDELAIRFKHRIVSIHCFANGNGRHSRLMADIIIKNIFKLPLFGWGSYDLSRTGKSRQEYLRTLKLADKGEFDPLLKFARS